MARELEEQLEALQKNFAGLAKTLGSSSKTLLKNSRDGQTFNSTQKVVNKSLQDYQKKNKRFVFGMESFGEAIDAAKQDVKEFKMNLKGIPSPIGLLVKGLKILKDATIGVGVAMVKTALALSDATKSFKGLEDVINVGIADVTLLGKVSARLAREIDTNVGAFRTLAQTGASFGSSIVMLRRAQEETLMPLTKFTDLIQSNSTTLARLFGTVDQGIPQIVPFMNMLRDMTMNEFAKFGLTLDETSTFLGTFLELERARGNTTRMTQAELLAGTRAYTKDLVVLGKLTGQTVDELNEQNMAMAADGVFQSQLANMNAKDAKTLSLGISALPGPLQQLAKEVIGLGAPISDTSQDLTALSGGAFNDAIKQFQQDGDLIGFQNSIKTISADVMKNGEAFGEAALAGGRFGEALNAIAASVGTAVSEADITGELNAAGDNIAEILNITTGELEKTKAALEVAVSKGLEPLALEGPKAAAGLKKLRELLDESFNEGITEMGEFFKQAGQFMTGQEVTATPKDDEKKKRKGNMFSFAGSNTPVDAFSYLEPYQQGTQGYRDFGSGTPVMLHGSEAVVPQGDISQALTALKGAMENVGGGTTVNNEGATTNNMASGVDMTTLNANTEQLIALTEKTAQHLNTLINIGAMTEKNTKNTNNNLANMSGSLV